MRRYLLLFALSLMVPFFADAQEGPSTSAPTTVPLENIVESLKNNPAVADGDVPPRDAKYLGALHFSPFDLLIPYKLGASIGYIRSREKSYELEYLRGSASLPSVLSDFGGATDERLSLIIRKYFGGSFNFNYGLTYFKLSVKLGNKYVSAIPNGPNLGVDVLDVQSAGFNIGIGNRWNLPHNIFLGVDWIAWSQPIFTLKRSSAFLDYASNPQYRNDIDDALKYITSIPRFLLFKFQLGVTF